MFIPQQCKTNVVYVSGVRLRTQLLGLSRLVDSEKAGNQATASCDGSSAEVRSRLQDSLFCSAAKMAAETSSAVKHRLPTLKYLDDFIRLRCAPALLEMGLYPDAKEITESMACWNGLRILCKLLKEQIAASEEALKYADMPVSDTKTTTSDSDVLDDAIVVVGDGSSPRTAALCAFLAGGSSSVLPPPAPGRAWRFISIDPILHYDNSLAGPPAPAAAAASCSGIDAMAATLTHLDGAPGGTREDTSNASPSSLGAETGKQPGSAPGVCYLPSKGTKGLSVSQVTSWHERIRGLTMSRAKIQEVAIRCRRAVIILMHAHVTMADVCAALSFPTGPGGGGGGGLVGAVVAPCCQWEPHLRYLYGRLADREEADPCLLSDKNTVRVWAQAPGTHAALHPLEGNPSLLSLQADASVTTVGEEGAAAVLATVCADTGAAAALALGLHRLAAVSSGSPSASASASLPTPADIASALSRPRDRRLAYKAARKLAQAQAQAQVQGSAAQAEEEAVGAENSLFLPQNRRTVGGETAILRARRGQVHRAAAALALAAAPLASPSPSPFQPQAQASSHEAGSSISSRSSGSALAQVVTAPGRLSCAQAGVLLRSLQACVAACASTAVVEAGSAAASPAAPAVPDPHDPAAGGSAEDREAAEDTASVPLVHLSLVLYRSAPPPSLPLPLPLTTTPLPAALCVHVRCSLPYSPRDRMSGSDSSSAVRVDRTTLRACLSDGECTVSDPPSAPAHVRLTVTGVVTAVRILSALVFYDLHDFAPPVHSAEAAGSSSGSDSCERSSSPSPSVCSVFAPTLPVCSQGQAEGPVSWQQVPSEDEHLHLPSLSNPAQAVVLLAPAYPSSTSTTSSSGLLLQQVSDHALREQVTGGREKHSGVEKGGSLVPFHSRRTHPTHPSPPGKRLQVVVAKPDKWRHSNEELLLAELQQEQDGCLSIEKLPLPTPHCGPWLTTLRPGDAVQLTGLVTRGFARHGNFLLAATEGLLLYDSVSRVSCAEVQHGSDATAVDAQAETPDHPGSTGSAGPAEGGRRTTAKGEAAEAQRNAAGQYVRRRLI